ncbi:MAG: protein translocase subunit SecF [Candidatus Nanopelagicales bacterium]
MSKLGSLGSKIYSGEMSYDIVGRAKTWYIISAVIILISLGGIFFRGFNLSVEFTGGAEFVVPSVSCSVEDTRNAVSGATPAASDPIVTQIGEQRTRVQTKALSAGESQQVVDALTKTCNVKADDIKVQLVGGAWGSEITKKAVTALIVFLILCTVFLTVYFEWRMALAAMIALVHDLVITVGIYALVGFPVTPAAVIGVLTILGYSLYDTVIVFDKVKENTRNVTGQSRNTYSELANLAVNQTLVRSFNTTITAILPVVAILVVGVWFMGAETLKDLALALLVGTIAGAYSSLFTANTLLCDFKEKQPEMKALKARVEARRENMSPEQIAREAKGIAGSYGDASGGNVKTKSSQKVGASVSSGSAAGASGERQERAHRAHRAERSQPKKAKSRRDRKS